MPVLPPGFKSTPQVERRKKAVRFGLLIPEERTPAPGLLAVPQWPGSWPMPTLSFKGDWEINYIGFSPSKGRGRQGKRGLWMDFEEPTHDICQRSDRSTQRKSSKAVSKDGMSLWCGKITICVVFLIVQKLRLTQIMNVVRNWLEQRNHQIN